MAGDGPYTTLQSDWVIRAIPTALAANIANKSSGHFDHEFIRHYLNGDHSGPKIKSDIEATLEPKENLFQNRMSGLINVF